MVKSYRARLTALALVVICLIAYFAAAAAAEPAEPQAIPPLALRRFAGPDEAAVLHLAADWLTTDSPCVVETLHLKRDGFDTDLRVLTVFYWPDCLQANEMPGSR